MAIRVTEAADILGVSANTVRNYCKQGILPFEWNAANQRVFDKQQLLVFKNKRLGILQEKPKETIVFYTRSSNGNDILLKTQEKLLTEKYGTPSKIYSDKASGLNENRKGLKALIKDAKKGHYTAIAITNKDRLTRFGYSYLVELFQLLDIKILLLESEEAPKEPQEALLQDFMSLIASFSGKFYRLRGYTNQKKLLHRLVNTLNKKKNSKHLYKSFTSKPFKITDHKDSTLNNDDTARVLTILKDEIKIITDIVEWSLENDKQLLIDYDQYDGYPQASKIGIALGLQLPENIFPFQINNHNNYQEGVITQEEYYKNIRKTSGNSRRDWLYHRRLFDEVSSWLERIKASNKVNSNDNDSDNIDNSDKTNGNNNGLSDSDKYISTGWYRTVNTTMPSNLTPKISLSITDAQYAKYVNKQTCFTDGYLKLKMVINGAWYHLYFKIDTNRFHEAVKFSLPDITITPNDTIKFNFCAVYDKIYKHISTEYFIGIDVNITNYVVASVINKDGVIVHSTTLSRRVNSLNNSIKATSKQIAGLHKKLRGLTVGSDEYVKTYNEICAQRNKNIKKKIELSIIAGQEIAYLSYMWDNAAVVFEDLSWIRNTMQNGRWNRGELVKRTEEYVCLNGGVVLKVNAAGTSTKCHHCDGKLTFKSWKIAYCTTCEVTLDRDINASVNIAKRGVKMVIKSSKTRSKAAAYGNDKNSTVLRTPVTIDSLRYNKRVSTRVKSVPTGKCDNKKRGRQFRLSRLKYAEEVSVGNNNGTVTYSDDMTVLTDVEQGKCLNQDPDKATSFYNNSNIVHYLLI